MSNDLTQVELVSRDDFALLVTTFMTSPGTSLSTTIISFSTRAQADLAVEKLSVRAPRQFTREVIKLYD